MEELFNLEAEQSLLGALLLNPDAMDQVEDIVTASDFYAERHRLIFRRIALLLSQAVPLDVITLHDALRQAGDGERSGGIAYLNDLVDQAPGSANAWKYAKIVAEKRALRDLMAAADEIAVIAGAEDGSTAEARIGRAQDVVLALAEKRPRDAKPMLLSDVLPGVLERIEERFESDSPISGVATHYAAFDEKTSGLQPGDLIIVAGRPSMGKTAFALNIAENVSLDNIGAALVFSMEMGEQQLALRTLSRFSRVSLTDLRSGRLKQDDFDHMAAGLGKVGPANLVIDADPGLSVSQMRSRARRVKRERGLALIVIDYLQLMTGVGNSRNEELGGITRALKLLARELEVPIVLLSQLSRKVEERANKRPILSDLRESGAIEQDADVVVMMYRDEYYNPDSAFKGIAEAIINKQRMGECGTVMLHFEGQYSHFTDASQHALSLAAHAAKTSGNRPKTRGMPEEP